MKILIIIGSFKMGGAERMSINTGEELSNRGHEIYYIVQRPIFEIPHSIPQDRIFVLRNLNRRDLFYKIRTLFFGVGKVSREIKPDVIIGFTRFSSFLANFTFHSKIIARFDAYPYRMSKKQRIWADFIIRSPLIKNIIVPSTDMIEALNRVRPSGRKKYTLIPNSINAESISEKSEYKNEVLYDFEYISAMGRFSPQKNFKLLIKAYAQSRLLNKLRLVLIGDGAYRHELEDLVKDLNLSDKIIFTGSLSNPFPIIKRSKFFVNPSKYESFGNVILEALILGKPVIATNCNFGPADIIENNVNGFLIEDDNLSELVEKLNLLGENDLLREELGVNSLGSAEKFYLKNIGDKWEQLIKA